MIDNELLDHYGSRLGPYGLAVYMALARFANQDGACWPSLSTIARKTGMSRPQVIREIAKLKDVSLIAVEHQVNTKGEYSSNIYVLLDTAVPSLEPGVVSDSNQGGISQILPLVSPGDHGGISQIPKQNPKNKTQHCKKTQETTPSETANNSNQLEINKDVVVALTRLGLAEKVANKLTQTCSEELIQEKIAYLDFLQAEYPSKVQNPRGWLRRAIEQNYAAPDGFLPKEEREQQAAEGIRQTQEAVAQVAEFQERIQLQQAAHRQALDAQYGTTEEDIAFWKKAQWEIKFTTPPHIAELVADMEILKVKEDSIAISVKRPAVWHQLQHPGTKKALQKALAHVAGQMLAMEVVLDKDLIEERITAHN
jgi:hypothetical protein